MAEMMEVIKRIDNENPRIDSYGGESYVDGLEFDDYSLQVGDLTLSDIDSVTYKEMARLMVNHLIMNGHTCLIVPDPHQDIPARFIWDK